MQLAIALSDGLIAMGTLGKPLHKIPQNYGYISMRTVSKKTKSGLKHLVDNIAASRQISRSDYLQLTSSLLSDYRMTEEERLQISRIFDHIQTGQLHLID